MAFLLTAVFTNTSRTRHTPGEPFAIYAWCGWLRIGAGSDRLKGPRLSFDAAEVAASIPLTPTVRPQSGYQL